jgi:hypothetical protein
MDCLFQEFGAIDLAIPEFAFDKHFFERYCDFPHQMGTIVTGSLIPEFFDVISFATHCGFCQQLIFSEEGKKILKFLLSFVSKVPSQLTPFP